MVVQAGMKVLALMAHADDETLGCGGYLAKLAKMGAEVSVVVLSDGLVTARGGIQDNGAFLQAACAELGVSSVYRLHFADQKFDTYPLSDLVNETLALGLSPDCIISHDETDLNLDHRIVSQVAKILARPRGRAIQLIACESPLVSAYNGQAFCPNFYVDISESLPQKIAAFGHYAHELRPFPSPCSPEGITTLAQFRGMEAGILFAEAYRIVRMFA